MIIIVIIIIFSHSNSHIPSATSGYMQRVGEAAFAAKATLATHKHATDGRTEAGNDVHAMLYKLARSILLGFVLLMGQCEIVYLLRQRKFGWKTHCEKVRMRVNNGGERK